MVVNFKSTELVKFYERKHKTVKIEEKGKKSKLLFKGPYLTSVDEYIYKK